MKNIFYYFFFLVLIVNAQNEATQWRFNNNSGLDFSTSPPTPTVGGPVAYNFCGASMADASGNLLFYSNGLDVFNNQNMVMANGNALGGTLSSQAALAIRQPGSANVYYLFSNNGFQGLKYAIVDMSLSAGQGSVVIKNQSLVPNIASQFTAVRHCNGIDSWIITHKLGTNEYDAFLLTSAGISTVPVISAGSLTVTSFTTDNGQMKASPDGQYIMLNCFSSGTEVSAFNTATGMVSNSLYLLNNVGSGCEFSSDGGKLYGVSSQSVILQWDLCAGTASDIIGSMDTIGISSSTAYGIQLLQMGPDEKIYATHGNGFQNPSALGVINFPGVLGSGSNYNDLGQPLVPGTVGIGLPGFESHLLRAKFNYTAANSCATATFNVPSPGCKTNGVYNWNFGDPGSGAANTSTLNNPVHNFSSGGTYTVKLASSFNSSCAPDTLIRIITIASSPSITLSGKLNFCKNETSVITAGGASTYTWNSGSNSSSIAVNNSSPLVYTVSATFSNNCTSSRVFSVNLLNCTGLNEITDQPIKVYPNPIGEALFIETEHPVKILLYDALGRIVLQQNLSEGKQTINTEHVIPGIYFMSVAGESGIKRIKLVKE